MSEKKAEVVVFTHENLEVANKIRSLIQNNFSYIWIYIFKQTSGYEVSVASQWGARLPDKELFTVKELVKYEQKKNKGFTAKKYKTKKPVSKDLQ